MPKPIRTRPVSGAQVRAYAGKAEEYADAAASEIDAARYIAATSLADHAGINAGDDHNQVLPLLRQAGPDGVKVDKELRRLLPLKSKAEYDPDDVTPGVAAKAVERAQRCVAVARAVAAGSTT